MNLKKLSYRFFFLLIFTTSLFLPPTLHFSPSAQAHETQQDNLQQTVFYNQKSHIYHKLDCIHAKRCTKNCIPMKKADAKKQGRACKVCGG